MAFRKMTPQTYPPRQWSLVGYPGVGKSTFAAQMRGPIVPIDADHRFREVLHTTQSDVYELSDSPVDNVDPDAIARLLGKNMPGSGVKTIVVDSLTAIITPYVVQAMLDNDAGKNRNRSAAFKAKALAMRQLQDSVTRWGCDVLWIYHLQDGRDARAQEVTTATVSRTELARLTRSLNAELEVVRGEDGQRGIHVNWARRGNAGMTVWDETGGFIGMPERIEEAMYGGLTTADQDAIAQAEPDVFSSPAQAINWAFERGAFEALPHARNAYDKVKREGRPGSARQMADLWKADVHARLEQKAQEAGQQASQAEGEGGAGEQPQEASAPAVDRQAPTEADFAKALRGAGEMAVRDVYLLTGEPLPDSLNWEDARKSLPGWLARTHEDGAEGVSLLQVQTAVREATPPGG